MVLYVTKADKVTFCQNFFLLFDKNWSGLSKNLLIIIPIEIYQQYAHEHP